MSEKDVFISGFQEGWAECVYFYCHIKDMHGEDDLPIHGHPIGDLSEAAWIKFAAYILADKMEEDRKRRRS